MIRKFTEIVNRAEERTMSMLSEKNARFIIAISVSVPVPHSSRCHVFKISSVVHLTKKRTENLDVSRKTALHM